MSDDTFPPFIKWGDYKSKDSAMPDKLHVHVTEVETFETEYGVSVNAKVNGVEVAIPLRNFNSPNTSLLKSWRINVRNGRIKKGKKFVLYTFLGKSKNGRDIRRWIMEFDSKSPSCSFL
jgi:hypothetical protein